METSMPKTLPTFASLKRNYPTSSNPERVKSAIGGTVDDSWVTNTCVIRISQAFNYCGNANHIIPTAAGLMTVKGADKMNYALRVQEFIDFLRDQYGAPHVIRAGENISKTPFLNKTGIIAWRVNGWSDATGHFTLWDGQDGLYVGGHDYFAMPKRKPDGGGAWLTKAELWRC